MGTPDQIDNQGVPIYFDDPSLQPAKPSPVYQLEAAIGDAFTFIRSTEANQSLATVSLDDLIQGQIARNGTTQQSQAGRYNPYSYDPTKAAPAGTSAQTKAPQLLGNYASGTDTNRPTKMDRVTALVNNIRAVVKAIQSMPVVEVAPPEGYADGVSNST